jgi:hypothetical protein
MTAIARHAPGADVVVLRGRRAAKRWLTAAKPTLQGTLSRLDEPVGPSSTVADVYGVRPMKASSLVWTSASSGTWTRGPY